jgi:hypothetical protein
MSRYVLLSRLRAAKTSKYTSKLQAVAASVMFCISIDAIDENVIKSLPD